MVLQALKDKRQNFGNGAGELGADASLWVSRELDRFVWVSGRVQVAQNGHTRRYNQSRPKALFGCGIGRAGEPGANGSVGQGSGRSMVGFK